MPVPRLVRFVAQDDGQQYYGAADENLKVASVLDCANLFSQGAKPTETNKTIARLLCPLSMEDCRSIVCIGLNYRDHADEAKMAIPTVPVVFHKPVTALAGPYDDLDVPEMSWSRGKLDYEAELVIVIGTKASRVSKEDALDYVYGYTVGNDFSNRTWQLDPTLGGGQWCYSKSFDFSAPIGPAIVSKDILDPAKGLRIRTMLNGEVMQDGNTNNMIFSVAEIVSFLSQGMTLLPGTLIFTGTPAGVGFGRKPSIFTKDGDVLKVKIDGIGEIENKIVYAK
ncbi:hypothetical protein DM02DRAFT_615777 [Periconia macrospinosa]|uniref:Fumarylacetoacetase-like C-terminal domain-containing protein n=1 Tax=Periconia macrospinosa TaxID=97972 RepID=A0A2V1DKQ3_9PLEO|nr:hypothetical protein DM02DRAFT_615777 [Periconia macrospinosa]